VNGETCGVIRLKLRKATLASIAAKASADIRFNEHIEGDGPTVSGAGTKCNVPGWG